MIEHIRCSEAQSHLHLLVGDDLEAPLSERVHAHLSGCAACSADFERVRAAREQLVQLRNEPVTVNDVWPGVRAELAREGRFTSTHGGPSVPAAPRRIAASAWWIVGLAATAAAAALWAQFGLGLFERSQPESERSAPPIAEVTPNVVPGAIPVENPLAPDASPDLSMGAPVETAELSLDPATQLSPGSDDQLSKLRRVEPGDERLRDSALPFIAPGARREPFLGGSRGARSLVSESAWR
jgi:anti-sigma factor RsiW